MAKARKNFATNPNGAHRALVAGLCLTLAAITFAVFGRALHCQFVNFDDDSYVYENPIVRQGLTARGIVWAFTQPHFANWHALTWLSHELDCQLYGLQPGGHHLTSALLHIASVIALFLVLRRMTGVVWRSAFVAALFAIHPLRAESVAWVAERKDVLSGLFFMLTIGAYLHYARRPASLPRYSFVVLLFLLGLLSKSMLVTMPAVLLLLDYWPLKRAESLGRLVIEKLPLMGLSAAACVITLLAQRGSIQSSETYPLAMRLENALTASAIYLRQMVYPADLAAFYPHPRGGFPAWELAVAGLVLAGVSLVAYWQRRKQPWIMAGWAWYLVMLLPVAGIIQVGAQAHADRYTYLPQIGIYVAVTWWVAEMTTNWPAARYALGFFMAGVIGALMICAWKQVAYWQNSEVLWTHTIACTTDNYLAHNNVGAALFKEGRANEAIPQYNAALQIQPGYPDACYGLANVALQKGNVDDAISWYQQALQSQPDDARVHADLGVALFQKGKVNEALSHFQIALQLDRYNVAAYVNAGNALCRTGKVDEAICDLETALQLKPDSPEAHFNLGVAFSQKGQLADAIAQDKEALRLDPRNPAIEIALAWLLVTCPHASLRDGATALTLARQANDLTGGQNSTILRALAAAYAEVGRFDEAQRTAQRAIAAAQTAGQQDLAIQLGEELKRYSAGQRIRP